MTRIDLINFSGPYAVGKDTVINHLCQAFKDKLHRATTITTRPVNPKIDPSYRHISRSDFDLTVSTGDYLVNSQIDNSVFYGTDLAEIREQRSHGRLAIHSVFAGPAGAGALRSALGSGVLSIALVPPGDTLETQLDVLRGRLIGRNRDSPEVIEARIGKQAAILSYIAQNPMVDTPSGSQPVFDRIAVSGDLAQLLAQMEWLVRSTLSD